MANIAIPNLKKGQRGIYQEASTAIEQLRTVIKTAETLMGDLQRLQHHTQVEEWDMGSPDGQSEISGIARRAKSLESLLSIVTRLIGSW